MWFGCFLTGSVTGKLASMLLAAPASPAADQKTSPFFFFCNFGSGRFPEVESRCSFPSPVLRFSGSRPHDATPALHHIVSCCVYATLTHTHLINAALYLRPRLAARLTSCLRVSSCSRACSTGPSPACSSTGPWRWSSCPCRRTRTSSPVCSGSRT